MDSQFVQPQDNVNPVAPTPAPVPINPSEPQPLFAPDAPIMAPKKPKKGKVLAILLVLLLLAAVGGGAYYYFMVMQKDTDRNQTAVQTEPAPEPEPVAKECLVAADYDSIYKEISGTTRPTDTTYGGEKPNYSQELSFNPDSVDFSAPLSTSEGTITAFATFTKANAASKEFKLTITGHYANEKQAEIDLANKRAEKVKELLVKKGADAELIVVEKATLVKPEATTNVPATDAAAVTAKTVKVSIDPTCKAAPAAAEATPAKPAQ